MMKIGKQVVFDGIHGEYMVGYIVKIEIDPFEEDDYDLNDPEEYATYTIRVFKDFYQYGYADFQRSRSEIALY